MRIKHAFTLVPSSKPSSHGDCSQCVTVPVLFGRTLIKVRYASLTDRPSPYSGNDKGFRGASQFDR